MSGMSTYQAQKTITDTLVTPPAALYLALFTADPTDANITANEVSAAWYVRKLTGAFSAPGATVSSGNSNEIAFPAVTGASVQVSHWGIYDALTSGNLIYSGAFPSPKTFAIADIPFVSANTLVLTFE